jgi:hypothetical protein
LQRRGGQRLLLGHRRQNAGKTLGEHGFTGARRANHEHAVAAGGGDFERPFGRRLALDVRQVRKDRGRRRRRIGGTLKDLAPRKVCAHLQQ